MVRATLVGAGLPIAEGRKRLALAPIRAASGRPNTGPAFSSNARNSLAKCSECVSMAR